MKYLEKIPSKKTAGLVKVYWWADSEGDGAIKEEKIIPDGYPELIVHFGDPYRINNNGQWEWQEKCLLAGQITKYFYLENTGKTRMIGIKLQPATLTKLFGIDMKFLVDKVFGVTPDHPCMEIVAALDESASFLSNVENLERFFEKKRPKKSNAELDRALSLIISGKGTRRIDEIVSSSATERRTLERQFSRYIGLSPKRYSRIVRLKNIFETVQKNEINWSEIVYENEYYDQAHFINDFREFTGCSPSAYGFDERNFANFFMNRP